MSLIMWMLAFWLLASVGVAFFALCLIRGGASRDEDEQHLALEPKSDDDESRRAAVA